MSLNSPRLLRRLNRSKKDRFPVRFEFGKVLAEVDSLRDIVSREADELADVVNQAIDEYPNEDPNEDASGNPNEAVKRLIHRSMVLDQMRRTLDETTFYLHSKNSSFIKDAFKDNSGHMLPEIVRYSYNHFPELRSIVSPNSIKKLSDFYYNISPEKFYKDFSKMVNDENVLNRYVHLRKDIKEVRKHPERPTIATLQSAQPQECKTRLDLRENRVLPWNYENIVFEELIWDVREKPSESTVECTERLDDILFRGPVLLRLPNISEAIFYQVPMKGCQTARATLMAIYEFYQSHRSNYTVGGRVWAGGLVEMTPHIWQFDLSLPEADEVAIAAES